MKYILCAALVLIPNSISPGQISYRFSRVAQAEEEGSAIAASVYRENCAACHGEKGDGKGPQAYRLNTKPRDFTKGVYKFRSTPSGSLPMDRDIYRTITQGVRGTSMLAQLQLSEQERWAVVQYLKSFSKRFTEEKPGQRLSSRNRQDGMPSWSRWVKRSTKKPAATNVMAHLVKAKVHRRMV